MRGILNYILSFLEKNIEYCVYLKAIFIYKIYCFANNRDYGFKKSSMIISKRYGYYSEKNRTRLYEKTLSNSISKNVTIRHGVYFKNTEVIIEDNVYVGANCFLGNVIISKNCRIANNVKILSGRRQHRVEIKGSPLSDGELQQIHIGKNSWLGESSIIMGNIGDNCIVGAGSVVVSNIPNNSTVIGNPAKMVDNK